MNRVSTQPRPRVFVGSSVEALATARAIQANLEYEAEVTLWNQGAFALGDHPLRSLVETTDRSDFAILVLKADDLTHRRGEAFATVRDNLLFELGLFIGAMGAERTFFVTDRGNPPQLPSDLEGITPATFEVHSDGNLRAALGPACTQIAEQMHRLGPKPLSQEAPVFVMSDRKYYEYASRWYFSESPIAGYWQGRQIAERSFQALKPIPRWTYNLIRRSDHDIPFSMAVPEPSLGDHHRSGSGHTRLAAPRHASGRLTFDVEFDPPLRVGEDCSFAVELTVPAHKAATYATLLERPHPQVPVPGGGEYASVVVDGHIEQLAYEVYIPERLGSKAHGCQAISTGLVDPDEQRLIDTGETFTQELIDLDGESTFRLALHRANPPQGMVYRIFWRPPH